MQYFPPTKEQVAQIKEDYPAGTQIRLNFMNDPHCPVPEGTIGEVISVDDAATLHMKWENGRSLGLVVGEDSFSVISKPEQEQTMGAMGGQS